MRPPTLCVGIEKGDGAACSTRPLGRSHELIADRKQVLRPPSFLSVPATARILEINSRLPNNSAQSLCNMRYHFTYIMLGA